MIVNQIQCNLCLQSIPVSLTGMATCRCLVLMGPTGNEGLVLSTTKQHQDAKIHICLDCWQGLKALIREGKA